MENIDGNRDLDFDIGFKIQVKNYALYSAKNRCY